MTAVKFGEDGRPVDAVDLGHDTWFTKKIRDGVWVGIHEWHREPNGEYSAGFIPFTGRNPDQPVTWDIVSEDPLTLSPSLACGMCGHHGFVRGGRWEPC